MPTTSIYFHQDLVAILRKFTILYDMVNRWCQEFKYGWQYAKMSMHVKFMMFCFRTDGWLLAKQLKVWSIVSSYIQKIDTMNVNRCTKINPNQVTKIFLARFVAVDESWNYHYDVETKYKVNGNIESRLQRDNLRFNHRQKWKLCIVQ